MCEDRLIIEEWHEGSEHRPRGGRAPQPRVGRDTGLPWGSRSFGERQPQRGCGEAAQPFQGCLDKRCTQPKVARYAVNLGLEDTTLSGLVHVCPAQPSTSCHADQSLGSAWGHSRATDHIVVQFPLMGAARMERRAKSAGAISFLGSGGLFSGTLTSFRWAHD